MPLPSGLVAAFLSVEAAIAVAMALLTWERRHEQRAALPLFVDLVFITGIQLGAIGQVLVSSPALTVTFYKLSWNAQLLLPIAWVPFALYYTGRDNLVSARILGPVLAPFALWTVLLWLNPGNIYFSGFTLANGVLVPGFGPAFWLNIVYGYALVGVGVVIIADQFLRSPAYRLPVGMLLIGVTIPWFGNVADIGHLFPGLPVTALIIIVTPLTWYLALFVFSALEVLPTARDRLLELMEEGAIVIDRTDRIVAANPAAARTLGLSPGSLDGSSVTAITDRLPAVESMLTAEPMREQLTAAINSETRHLDVRTTPLESADDRTDEAAGHLVLIRDVTPLKERELELQQQTEQLQRQNNRLDRFASVVSHDLRNPLTLAMGSLDMARETGSPEAFDRVEEAHSRIDSIIEDVLTLAREGQAVEDPTEVDFEAVVTAAWDTVDTADAVLSVAIDDGVVRADHDRLRRILENLFRNAVEHGSTSNRTSAGDAVDHGGEDVTVEVGTTDSGFYVSDDGPGIPESERTEVFKSGYSTDGTGLGLAIVRDIAEAHGWDVRATESESGGARFEFSGVEFVE